MHRFGDIAIVVKDATKSAEWYRDRLGWTTASQDGHWVTVRVKGSPVLFHLCEHRPLERGNTGIGFVTKDVRAEEKRLRAKGVRFTRRATKTEWGTFAMFRDPDGNQFWLSDG
jgi:catechol 2,3-dioxygenase-like lactoylglutathione lyase family enzyme